MMGHSRWTLFATTYFAGWNCVDSSIYLTLWIQLELADYCEDAGHKDMVNCFAFVFTTEYPFSYSEYSFRVSLAPPHRISHTSLLLPFHVGSFVAGKSA